MTPLILIIWIFFAISANGNSNFFPGCDTRCKRELQKSCINHDQGPIDYWGYRSICLTFDADNFTGMGCLSSTPAIRLTNLTVTDGTLNELTVEVDEPGSHIYTSNFFDSDGTEYIYLRVTTYGSNEHDCLIKPGRCVSFDCYMCSATAWQNYTTVTYTNDYC
ncbi:uncharacterized protein LOC110855070 [Folsomia candida]|uniref:Histone-lysine N-methyltransferase SUVR1 n=1 Tax=Folsomia candida TaxID=158441 RepID=A0A226DVC5_FOLCA|nr:uncharacterized protein LOC110855070 [Folsomia candida]OXA48978.1 Histone-lysine N-methyltransferase SUVR1 [Folsomia candida]